ncbi:MAG: PDR/VanB family oxidoreductase [Polaromonas sp.]|nr:PDR/VanB family oxidoreductase [Polaromonas sp.]
MNTPVLEKPESPADALMTAMTVRHKRKVADDIFLFELAPPAGQQVMPFNAGSHVVIVTPSGLTRRYSLCNSPAQTDAYVVAIKRDAKGLGGSISMADRLHEGDTVSVSRPENYFAVDPATRSALLIAGGIGITPILAMVHELTAQGIAFRVIYCSRSPETTAFAEELSVEGLVDRVRLHHDHGDVQKSLDLKPLLADHAEGEHLYCCGPRPLMAAVRDLSRHWPSGTVHFEDFGTSEPVTPPGADRAFTVKLARKGITVPVPVGTTILEALRGCGIAVPSSCESGTCGSCRTGLLSGEADHRDFVLDEDEYDREIMICVSRAKTAELELDI